MIPLLYNTAVHVAAVPAAPLLYAWARVRRPRFREALPQRLGRTRGLPPRPAHAPLWLHGVSLGEVRTWGPLIDAWIAAHPDRPLLVSSATETGLDAARRLYPQACVTPFPLDTPPAVNALLHYWRPACVALLETEIWPNFFWACAKQRIPLCIVSGRVSERTARRPSVLGPLWRSVLAAGTAFAMQTAADAERIQSLGAPVDRISVLGDLKWDAVRAPAADTGAQWRDTWGLDADTPHVLWGSTHAPEDALALEAWRALRRTYPNARLTIVPRHPERFDAVADLMRRADIRVHRRSQGVRRDWEALLWDTIGDLPQLYATATVAVLGGTFAPIGGHNLLEPLAAGVPTLVGPHTHHIQRMTTAAVAADAVVQTTANHVATAIHSLVDQPKRRAELAANGRGLLADHQGVTARILALLESLCPPSASCEA